MQVLALDFDGVIADSAPEAFEVARRAYLALRPGSPLGDADAQRLQREFLALMPLGNRAEDYATALAAIEAGVALGDQAAYDAFRAAQDPGWLAAYHARFYALRTEWSDRDRPGWLEHLPPYAPFVALLRRRAGRCTYAIATSKDRRSVGILLAHYGLVDLFAPELVLDKEAGVHKRAHIGRLLDATRVDPQALTFVDDKVNHLDGVAPLGVRCALATWGYNGPREHVLAAERGYAICTLEDAEARLFG